MHPDEQAHLLKQQSHRRNASSSPVNSDDSKANALEAPIAEWVLPTHVREKWTLRQFAEVFDVLDEPVVTQEQTWDVHKRVVLATLQDDSTIVYYVSDILNARQNVLTRLDYERWNCQATPKLRDDQLRQIVPHDISGSC